jgi:putative restriction endonuclease
MPLALAWEAFGEANGAANLAEMRQRVLRYRDLPTDSRDPIEIGCRILTQPFFWPEHLWLSPPASWSPNIVRFKTFAAEEAEGRALWEAVLERSTAALAPQTALVSPIPPPPGLAATPQSHYGEPMLMRPRLGQGGFRLMVTGLYERKCAVTRERTLPALEAAHIRPYSEGGAHTAPNGILLRRDVHSLFDQGYVTVTPQFTFEVSRRIKQEFENGREYYALHGREVKVPDQQERRPDTAALRWHNEERYLG